MKLLHILKAVAFLFFVNFYLRNSVVFATIIIEQTKGPTAFNCAFNVWAFQFLYACRNYKGDKR